MTTKIGINGFGRIGGTSSGPPKERGADLDFVAVNDITAPRRWPTCLKYDSVLGRFDGDVEVAGDGI